MYSGYLFMLSIMVYFCLLVCVAVFGWVLNMWQVKSSNRWGITYKAFLILFLYIFKNYMWCGIYAGFGDCYRRGGHCEIHRCCQRVWQHESPCKYAFGLGLGLYAEDTTIFNSINNSITDNNSQLCKKIIYFTYCLGFQKCNFIDHLLIVEKCTFIGEL